MHYLIYRKENDGEWVKHKDNLLVTWLYLDDLQLGVLYSFKIEAVNRAGISPFSKEV